MAPKNSRGMTAQGMATELPSSVPAAQEADRRRIRLPSLQASPKGSPTASPRGSRSASPIGQLRRVGSPGTTPSLRSTGPIERGGEHTPPGRTTPPSRDDTAATPSVDRTTPIEIRAAPPAGTAADTSTLESEKRSCSTTLASLEAELKHYANLFSIEERRSRADDFHTRAAALRSGNAMMRTEIGTLRNSDRLLVELREQQGAVEKHMRLRKAQIRQKEATIDVITRRCREQGEGSQSLLNGIEAELTRLDALCMRMDGMGALADRVHPVGTLRSILEQDEARYAALEGLLSRAMGHQLRSHAEDLQLRQLRGQSPVDGQTAATGGSSPQDADDTDVSATCETDKEVADAIEAHRAAWHTERAALMTEKANVQRQLRDLTFHVRRGTNVKSMSQNPCPPTAEFLVKEVRELQLTLGELRSTVDSDRLVLWELERTSASLSEVRREERATWGAELEAVRSTRARQEAVLEELMTYEGILQAKHRGDPTNGTALTAASEVGAAARPPDGVVHGALVLATPTGHRHFDAARGVSAAGTPAVSASEWSSGREDASPRLAELEAFTKRQREKAVSAAQSRRPSNVMDRLTAPTKSRSMFLQDHRREQAERAERMASVIEHRPQGCNHRSAAGGTMGAGAVRVAVADGGTPKR